MSYITRQNFVSNAQNRGPAPNIRPGLSPTTTAGPGNATISRPITPTYDITTPRAPQIYYIAPESNNSTLSRP